MSETVKLGQKVPEIERANRAHAEEFLLQAAPQSKDLQCHSSPGRVQRVPFNSNCIYTDADVQLGGQHVEVFPVLPG